MALGKKCSTLQSDEELEFGFIRYTRGLRRKRTEVFSNQVAPPPVESALLAPTKKRCCCEIEAIDYEKTRLEALPQDILIRILCGVNHNDLKQLCIVSKSIKEAALIARESHFAFSTPVKTRVFRTSIDFDEDSECEAPNAPKQARFYRSRINRKNLEHISVALFTT